VDRWRLFDLEQNNVTFVDDVRKTTLTRTLQELVREKNTLGRQPMPPTFPRLLLGRTQEKRSHLGREVAAYVVESGSYRRELWISQQPFIDERLFALATLSEPAGGAYPSAMASLHRSLAGITGYPLIDVTTLTYGAKEMKVERQLQKVESKPVPESLIQIPKDYRDLTPPPATAPASGRPRVASPPSNRSARATE
jgi:hypothetical protein